MTEGRVSYTTLGPRIRSPASRTQKSSQTARQLIRGAANLTCCDYNLVMSNVRIADLKARLSEHLRAVRNGSTLTVLDRDTPVAQIVPYAAQPLEMRKAKRRVRDLKLPPKSSKRTDSLAVLLDDRRRR